jgi:hypothetical protein
VFFVSTLIVTEYVSRDWNDPYMIAEIVGPTGTFYVYAGQYQVDAKAFIQDADTPAYVAVTGKPKRSRPTTATLSSAWRTNGCRQWPARTATAESSTPPATPTGASHSSKPATSYLRARYRHRRGAPRCHTAAVRIWQVTCV